MNIETGNTAGRMGGLVPNPKAKLRDQFHEVARFKYLAQRTEDTYWQWVVRYLKFHRRNGQWRHPRELQAQEMAGFLSHLASGLKVAAATQSQALNALIFLYREVLHVQVEEIGSFERVRRPARLPEVLSREEVKLVLAAAAPEYQLPLRLLYGTGMRLNGESGTTLLKSSQLRKPSERFLWAEGADGRGENLGSWQLASLGTAALNFSDAMFGDSPAAFHGDTAGFSFADGHAESHKWLDATTLTYARSANLTKDAGSPEKTDAQNFSRRDQQWVGIRFPSLINP